MGNFESELGGLQSIPKDLVFDVGLSDRARFLYVYMACKESGWNFDQKLMCSELGYSADTFRKYVGELMSSGWLVRIGQSKDGKGCFGNVKYVLKAFRCCESEPCGKKPESEKTRIGKTPTRVENRQYYNNITILDTDTSILHIDADSIQQQDDVVEKENKRKKLSKKEKKEKDEMFEKCWVAYNRKGSKKKSREQWERLSVDDRSRVLGHIRAYVSTRELCYQRDFERYLRDRLFDDVIFDGGKIVYDPSKVYGGLFGETQYRPDTTGNIHWNEHYGCYIFTGVDENYIFDGYDNNNRPDGAEIKMNNGRGTVVWSKEHQKWEKK